MTNTRACLLWKSQVIETITMKYQQVKKVNTLSSLILNFIKFNVEVPSTHTADIAGNHNNDTNQSFCISTLLHYQGRKHSRCDDLDRSNALPHGQSIIGGEDTTPGPDTGQRGPRNVSVWNSGVA